MLCGEKASNITKKVRVQLTDCIYSLEMNGLIRSAETLHRESNNWKAERGHDPQWSGRFEITLASRKINVKWESAEES